MSGPVAPATHTQVSLKLPRSFSHDGPCAGCPKPITSGVLVGELAGKDCLEEAHSPSPSGLSREGNRIGLW